MKNNFSYKGVRDYLRTNYKMSEKEISKNADPILAIIMVGTALVPSPVTVAVLLSLIAPKNELLKVAQFLSDQIKTPFRDKETYLQRQQRAEYAYTLICYTSFAEAFDGFVKDELVPAGLTLEEEVPSLQEAIDSLMSSEKNRTEGNDKWTDPPFETKMATLPHPVDWMEKKTVEPAVMIQVLTDRLQKAMCETNFWKGLNEKRRKSIHESWKKLPEKAGEMFRAQYVDMAKQFPDFHFWSQFHEHQRTRDALLSMDGNIVQAMNELDNIAQKLDVGFSGLEKSIRHIPSLIESEKNLKALKRMERHYQQRVDKPIFKDEVKLEPGESKLSYPKRGEIFIPQNFRVIHVTNPDLALEDKSLWKNLELHKNLSSFLIRYFTFPHSLHTPLLVLGHPGSGKSMFTEVLAAKLSRTVFKPIRIILRELKDVNQSLRSQIEEQIMTDSDTKVQWIDFRESLGDAPPLVILDGFDELLQASGRTFANYLREVHTFQDEEYRAGRPVRFLITSRITLIGKAELPDDCTVVCLESFDTNQQEQWVETWNQCNMQHDATSFRPFSPPYKQESWTPKQSERYKNITDLMEQPLLLTMLAMYDAIYDRAITDRPGEIDRPVLYIRLLRYFVNRQRRKGHVYKNTPKPGQEKIIDQDIERLGVTALGMFNRGRVSIQDSVLNADLGYYKLLDMKIENDDSHINSAQNLLGSFFFVHEDKAGKDPTGQSKSGHASYEFLHKTFGEFLTAHWIFSQVFERFMDIKDIQKSPRLKEQLPHELQNPNWPKDKWFSCLMHTPLHHEPVVVQMLDEWQHHFLKENKIAAADFFGHLDTILYSQFHWILEGQHFPDIMSEKKAYYAPLPVHGFLAIYSMNLIILRTIFDREKYRFDEASIDNNIKSKLHSSDVKPADSESEATQGYDRDRALPWDRLTHLWRSWYSLEGMKGLSNILRAERTEGCIIQLQALRPYAERPPHNTLDLVRRVGASLGDDLLCGLAGESYLYHYSYIDQDRLSQEIKLPDRASIELPWNQIIMMTEAIIHSKEDVMGVFGDYEDLYKNHERVLQNAYGKIRGGEFMGQPLLVQHFIRMLPYFPYHPDNIVFAKSLFRRAMNDKDINGIQSKSELFWDLLHAINLLVIKTRQIKKNYRIHDLIGEFHFVQMIRQHPNQATVLLSLAKEIGEVEPRWLKAVIHDMDPRDISRMIERAPGEAIAFLSFAKELGGVKPHWLEEVIHGVDPRDIARMIARAPGEAIAFLSFAKEFGRVEPQWLEEVIHRMGPRGISRTMIERDPGEAIAFLSLAKELGKVESRWLEEVIHLTDPMDISRMIGQNPGSVLAFLRFAKEIDCVQPAWFKKVIHCIDLGDIFLMFERNHGNADLIGFLEILSQLDPGLLRTLLQSMERAGDIKNILNHLPLKALTGLMECAHATGQISFSTIIENFIMTTLRHPGSPVSILEASRDLQKGEANTLTRQLQRRFGDLPPWASDKIAKADLSTLEAWSLRILEATTMEGVLADPHDG